MAVNAHQINFFDFSPRELRLEQAGETLRPSKDHDAGGICIQPMRRARIIGMIDRI